MQAAKNEMTADVDALHVKLQDVVKFIECVPTTVAEPDARLKGITAWMQDNQLDSVPARVTATEARATELAATFDQRCGELADALSALQASGSTGCSGFTSAPPAPKDRNVFDMHDYEIAELGSKPAAARWKKWRRVLESFVDTIGNSWRGTSGLLRQLRYREQPFTSAQLSEAISDAKARHDKTPDPAFYVFEEKADIL